MTNLIGAKNSFGIEYKFNSVGHYSKSGDTFLLGNIRLWVDGKYFGTLEDEEIISVYWGYFQHSNFPRIEMSHLVDLSVDQVFKSIMSDSTGDYSGYIFSPGPAFDDFIIAAYSSKEKLVFIWSLYDNHYYQYPDYPKEIQYAEVNKEKFYEAVLEFGKRIIDFQARVAHTK